MTDCWLDMNGIFFLLDMKHCVGVKVAILSVPLTQVGFEKDVLSTLWSAFVVDWKTVWQIKKRFENVIIKFVSNVDRNGAICMILVYELSWLVKEYVNDSNKRRETVGFWVSRINCCTDLFSFLTVGLFFNHLIIATQLRSIQVVEVLNEG